MIVHALRPENQTGSNDCSQTEPGRVRIVRDFRSESQTGIDESSQNLNQERSGLCVICTLKIRLAVTSLEPGRVWTVRVLHSKVRQALTSLHKTLGQDCACFAL